MLLNRLLDNLSRLFECLIFQEYLANLEVILCEREVFLDLVELIYTSTEGCLGGRGVVLLVYFLKYE